MALPRSADRTPALTITAPADPAVGAPDACEPPVPEGLPRA